MAGGKKGKEVFCLLGGERGKGERGKGVRGKISTEPITARILGKARSITTIAALIFRLMEEDE